jgi:hypothetical protein
MRRALAPLALVALAVLAVPSSAKGVTERGSYQLRLKPNPVFYATDPVEGRCSPGASPYVVGVPDSDSSRTFRFSRSGTLRATLLPELATFPVGPEWDLVVRESGRGVVATSTTHVGEYELTYPVRANRPFWLVACNKTGWPNATVSWRFTSR